MLDDIIVWWHPDGPHVFDVMPNASNTDRVIEAIGGNDITAARAVIAVQGPEARALARYGVPTRLDADRAVPRSADVDLDGVPRGRRRNRLHR